MSVINSKRNLNMGVVLFVAVCAGVLIYMLWPPAGQSIQSSGLSNSIAATQTKTKQTIATQLTDLYTQVESMHTALKHQSEQITQQAAHLKQYQTALIKRLTVQDEHIGQLGTVIAKINTALHEKRKQRRDQPPQKVRQTRRQSKPRVTLASVDLWGNNPVAVLQDQTSLLSLRTGQQYQDWEITNIDADQQTATLVKPNQKPIILRVHQ
ncbi:MAG: hypothetical protein K0U68_14645 [Gammaproteobacteria bacterium]|nr:hypothetical protein [Gammaproteobacteria bacterium]